MAFILHLLKRFAGRLPAWLILAALTLQSSIPVVSAQPGEQPGYGNVQSSPAPQVAPSVMSSSSNLGFIPPPVDLSYLKPEWKGLQGFLPSSWDWRVSGDVSPVKNQGSCGSCYVFASVGDFESRLLIDGDGLSDLSENNAKECNWFRLYNDTGGCYGGNDWWIADLFSQKGAVSETCDPYQDFDTTCNTSCPYQKTLLDWLQISGSSIPPTDVLKNYLLTYGPVDVAMYANDEFNDYDGTYTLNYPGYGINHAVLIVGWDDSLAYLDSLGQTHYGAWIVKNSWGVNWGDNGYFTIAYGAANIGAYAAVAAGWQNFDPLGKLYYYDEAGWNYSFGYTFSKSASGMVRITPTMDSIATRVEFWVTDAGSANISIYDTFSEGALSNLLAQKSLSFNEAGYHSVLLDEPVSLVKDDDVFVELTFTANSSTFPLAFDGLGPHQPGRSYVSKTGANGTWSDLGATSGDLTIRLRTTLPAPAAPADLQATPFSEGQINLAWNEASPVETGFKIERSPNGANGWQQIATTAANTQAYQDKTVLCQTTYYYRIKAFNAAGDSPYSDVAAATTPNCTIPQAPTGLSAQPYPLKHIILSWNDVLNETQYKIQRSLDGSTGWIQVGTVAGNITTWIDPGSLTPGVIYYYRVIAANLKGDSPPSKPDSSSPYAFDICLPLVKNSSP